MKKTMIVFAVIMAMAASASVFANVKNNTSSEKLFSNQTTQIASQGAHCSGTVGCDCRGFAPITNGEVWQQAYCKYCGHKRSCHR